MRVGILTGGGDCPGLNAAIRGAAKALINEYDAEIIGIEEGFLGLIERRTVPLSYKDVSGILHKGGTIIGTTNRASPFDYKGKDVSQQVADYYRELGLDCIISMGGDGSMTICYEMSKLGMQFVGVPKTIDNDLVSTERTFGFDTAVNVATDAIDRLQTTGQSHKRVMILETMGRYAGWIALYSGVASGADIILLPEFPYHLDEVIRAIEQRAKKQKFSIIVVAEGARPVDGETIMKRSAVEGSPDPIRLGGIGMYLQKQLEQRIESEVRTTILGHIQRGGTTSPYDRIFATNVGCYAASLVACKQYGRMVTVQRGLMSSVPLEEVAHHVRGVPRNNMSLISALNMGVNFGDPSLKIPLETLRDGEIQMG